MNRDRINADLERRTNYGEELSKLIWDHLNPVCHIFSLGLYKGDGMVLKRYNY